MKRYFVNEVFYTLQGEGMGCQSADGTYIRHRIRKRAGEVDGQHTRRGASELARFLAVLANTPVLPLQRFEAPSLPVHRAAAP